MDALRGLLMNRYDTAVAALSAAGLRAEVTQPPERLLTPVIGKTASGVPGVVGHRYRASGLTPPTEDDEARNLHLAASLYQKSRRWTLEWIARMYGYGRPAYRPTLRRYSNDTVPDDLTYHERDDGVLVPCRSIRLASDEAALTSEPGERETDAAIYWGAVEHLGDSWAAHYAGLDLAFDRRRSPRAIAPLYGFTSLGL